MEVIIVTISLLAVMAGISVIVVTTRKKQRRQKKRLLLAQLRQLGHQKQLRFSSEAYLKNAAIGLDGIKRTLLYFEPSTNSSPVKVIDIPLNQVQHCSTKHVSRSVYAFGNHAPETGTIIDTISLRFSFANDRLPEELIFFQSTRDHRYEMQDRTNACHRWQSSLSKLITGSALQQQHKLH